MAKNTIDMIVIEGPGGRGVVPASEAKNIEQKEGFKIIGPFQAAENKNDVPPEKPESGITDDDGNGIPDDLQSIRSDKALAEYVEKNEIPVDLTMLDSFRERKAAVIEAVEV